MSGESVGAFVAVKVDGREVRIPRSWLVGFCRAQGGLPAKSTDDAARWWVENRGTEKSTRNGEHKP